MVEFEHRTPIIPQFNFKNINYNSCQMLEFESLNCHNLNVQHMLIKGYKPILSQADHEADMDINAGMATPL